MKAAETEAGLEVAYKVVCSSKEDTYTNEDILKIIHVTDREVLCELRDDK